MLKKIHEEIYRTAKHLKDRDLGVWKLYLFLRFCVICCGIRSLFLGNYQYFLLCILSLILFLVPSFLERTLHIDFPSTLEKIVLLFIFSSEILGEIGAYYTKIPWWDMMLHATNGFLCAAIGFALVDILNNNDNINFDLSPIYCAVIAFCFSMTIGVLWEFFEYSADILLNLDMQKDTIIHSITTVTLDPNNLNHTVTIDNIENVVINGQELNLNGYLDIGLHDTMQDLMVNFIGAIIFSFFGYMHVKTKGNNEIAKHFIPKKEEN